MRSHIQRSPRSHSRQGRGGGDASVRANLTAIESLEARVLLSSVSFTGGGDGVSWTDPANWSTGQLPQSADDVSISAKQFTVIQLASGTQTVHSVNTLN